MAITLDADLATAFSTTDFAETLTFTTGGGAVSVTGYFNEGSDAVRINEVDIEAVQPSFEYRTSQAVLARGDTVTRSGTVYKVEKLQKTGVGVTVAFLKTN